MSVAYSQNGHGQWGYWGPGGVAVNPDGSATNGNSSQMSSPQSPSSPVIKPGDPNYIPPPPQFHDITDPNTGLISSPSLNVQPQSIGTTNLTPEISKLFGQETQVNRDPLHNLENYATSTSPSPWLTQALSNNTQNTTNAINSAANTGAGNTAAAESNLAMRGGLSGGARERVQTAGASATNAGEQNAANAGLANSGNLQLQEQAQKYGAMSALPGQEIAVTQPAMNQAQYLGNTAQAQQGVDLGTQQFNAAQNTGAQEYNINNSLNQLLQNRANTANTYNQQMAAWGANQTANAQGSGGKK